MERDSLFKEQAKVYLKIAERHLKMAKLLLENGFYDGVMFHAYHALESACSAGIGSKGRQIPTIHPEKLRLFRKSYPDLPFAERFMIIAEALKSERERSLYADIDYSVVHDPTLEYTEDDAKEALSDARFVVNKIQEMINSNLKGEEKV